MLSICIPHYNYVNDQLFAELENQCLALAIKFEILVIDDASATAYKSYLKDIDSSFCSVIFLEQNIGRSKIRNLLAKEAKYPWLLFLDADSNTNKPDFIFNYLQNLKADIISGGRSYSLIQPEAKYFLHWNYGVKIESKSKAQFHSNNFMIKKEVFNTLCFDEQITNYGYEDVVFGLEAKKLGLTMINIDNKVMHTGLKTNKEFLVDVEQALINLVKIETLRNDLMIENEVKILRSYSKLHQLRLTWLLGVFNQTIINSLRNILINSSKPYSNKLLSVWKIYYLHQIKSYKSNTDLAV
jgi:glycosyltransferase involved in cell wall biosynthesis